MLCGGGGGVADHRGPCRAARSEVAHGFVARAARDVTLLVLQYHPRVQAALHGAALQALPARRRALLRVELDDD